jgi:hypothetical protein
MKLLTTILSSLLLLTVNPKVLASNTCQQEWQIFQLSNSPASNNSIPIANLTYGFQFAIPSNYIGVIEHPQGTAVYTPEGYAYYTCKQTTSRPINWLEAYISVYPVGSSNRLSDYFYAVNPQGVNILTNITETRIGGQLAFTFDYINNYNTVHRLYMFFTPNRNNIIMITAPSNVGSPNSTGLNRIINSFNFGRAY